MNKKIYLLICVALISQSLKAQYIAEGGAQFRNYGFENWEYFDTSDTNSLEPVFWHAWMSAYGAYNPLQNAKYQQIWKSPHTRPGSDGNVSVKLTARDVLGLITANGGITNGRIHVGSTSVTDTTNFNITLREYDSFNTPLGMYPDSLTVWVAFVCEYSNQLARVRAIVHGDDNFCERANGTFNHPDMYCGEAMQVFPRTNNIYDTLNYHWTRFSIPFNYTGPCDNPAYVLFTAGTNQFPGQGAGNEYVLIDDILLIYNPTLTLGQIPVSKIDVPEEGYPINIPFIVEGTMSPSNLSAEPNVVIAQLSDKYGSFANPVTIGTLTTDVSGTINAVIPYSTPSGSKYRIRVVSTNYPLVSEDNGSNIIIVPEEGIDEHDDLLKLYPTVSDDFVRIEADDVVKCVMLFSADGRLVRKIDYNGSEKSIVLHIGDLHSGHYSVLVNTEHNLYKSALIKK